MHDTVGESVPVVSDYVQEVGVALGGVLTLHVEIHRQVIFLSKGEVSLESIDLECPVGVLDPLLVVEPALTYRHDFAGDRVLDKGVQLAEVLLQ